MKTKAITTLTMILLVFAANAQTGLNSGSKYGHGEDSVRCVNNISLFVEYSRQKNWKDALRPWTICYNECPASSQYIYTYGSDIIEWQISKAETDEEKEQHIQELLKLYDNRIKYYGDDRKYPEPYLLARKAFDYLKYYGSTTEGMKETLDQFEVAIPKLMKKFTGYTASTLIGSIQMYMQLNFRLYARSEITGEELITRYETSQSNLEQLQKATSKFDDKINPLKESLESNFANSGAADCETMVAMFTSKVEEGKQDKDLLTKVLNLFEKTGCTDSELYYTTSEYLHAVEPSASSAYGIAAMYLKNHDIDKALEYYDQALELEEDNARKADYLYQMAFIIFSKKNDYVKARSLAKQAVGYKPNWGAPYILIGQMYAVSAQKQEIGSKDIENQAGFWAAVDKFEQAKSVDPEAATEANQQINIYSNYFPGKEEIFFEEGFELDKPYKVGGWINETTICRPKE